MDDGESLLKGYGGVSSVDGVNDSVAADYSLSLSLDLSLYLSCDLIDDVAATWISPKLRR